MAKIAFVIHPARSHYNATFSLARGLRDRGHNIVYCGHIDYQSYISAQGFEYLVEPIAKTVSKGCSSIREVVFSTGLLRKLRSIRAHVEDITNCRAFDSLIEKVQPDVLLIDAIYSNRALGLLKFRDRIQFAILLTKVNLNRKCDVPPLTSHLMPATGACSRVRILLAWKRHFLTRWFLGRLGMSDFPVGRALKEALANCQSVSSAVSLDRLFSVGISSVPEFILSPREFDFPDNLTMNQKYIGPSVDFMRVEPIYDDDYLQQIARLQGEKKMGRPFVYCALGSMVFRYAHITHFLGRLLRAANGQEWNLMLAIDIDACALKHNAIPANVVILRRVPQLDVLRQCDLMITHGGMNSITEAILHEVPMLVYPATSINDQNGNAARVEFNGLGFRGNRSRDSAYTIRKKINALLNDTRIKANLSLMNKRIRSSAAFNGGARIVDEIMGLSTAHGQAVRQERP